MRMYEIHTGDVVRVIATSEEDALDKISKGDYDFVETYSEVVYVGSEIPA